MEEAYQEILLHTPLFKEIGREELKSLIGCLSVKLKKYEAGEYLFHAADQLEYMGIVVEGCVEIIKENIVGERHIIAFLEQAQMFGEAIVCTSNRVATISARARETTVVVLVPYKRVIQSCHNACGFHTQLVSNMLRILGDKNEMLNMKMELLLLKGMRQKLAAYLLREAYTRNQLAFNITPNREALAEFLNVSRTSMCRELARMKEEGIIDYYKNSFKIVDLSALKSCHELANKK